MDASPGINMAPRLRRLRCRLQVLVALGIPVVLTCFVAPPPGQRTSLPSHEPSLRRPASCAGIEGAASEQVLGEPGSQAAGTDRVASPSEGANVLSWVLSGLSAVYLAQFASFYCQCPGLIGSNGLEPLVSRPEDVRSTWLLHFFPSPELGVEVLALGGMLLSVSQLSLPQAALRHGPAGAAAFALLWWCWHDLVLAGGRFTCYQMDVILLDAAPLAILGALGLETQAVIFGLRWLLLRLYLGGGAVKLLSCDASWRDLSALHWHFQSQPLPNPLGNAAHLFMPDAVSHASTLAALVIEIGLAFLFLAPATDVRRFAFALQTVLQAGIAMAGNFGSFNFMTVVVALSLLEDEDLPLGPSLATRTSARVIPSKLRQELAPAVSLTCVLLAAGATAWTLHNQSAACGQTWGPQPMVWAALVSVPFVLTATVDSALGLLVALIFFLGSAVPLARGLGIVLPAEDVLKVFDWGAGQYGLFARMSGVGGRPTEVMEGALGPIGPWATIPFRYQVVETMRQPPFVFPHFPRLDWTYWFVPFGTSDSDIQGWLGQFLAKVQAGQREVLDLLDRPEFEHRFPDGPPQFLRLSPRTFRAALPGDGGAWWVSAPADMDSAAWVDMPKGNLLEKPVVMASLPPPAAEPAAWPGVPLLRAAADAGQETFVWATFAVAAAAAAGAAASYSGESGKKEQLER